MYKRNGVWVVAGLLAVALWMQPGPAAAVDPPRWVAALYVEAQRSAGLRWNPSPGATGYKVLRSTTPGSGYAEVAAPTTTQHFDTTVEPGTQYFYVLQAVAGADVSKNSEEKSITIPGQKKKETAIPKFSKVSAQESTEFGKTTYKVGLIWTPIPGAIAYNLYRTLTPGKDASLVASVSESQYVDATVEAEKTYYYSLSALDGSFQETARSPEEKVLIEKKKEVAVKKKKVVLAVKPRAAKLLWRKTRGDDDGNFTFREAVDAEYDDETGTVFATSNSTREVFAIEAMTGEVNAKLGAPVGQPGNLQDPMGIGLDGNGDLLVVDRAAKEIEVFAADGKHKRTIPLVVPPEAYPFPKPIVPFDVAVEPKSGDWFISDTTSGGVLVFDDKGKYQRAFGQPGAPWEIKSVAYMRFDGKGNLVLMAMARALYMTLNPADGALISSWGSNNPSVDGFIFPGGFDFDAAGNLLSVDRSLGSVRGFLTDGRYLFNMANEKADGPAELYLPKSVASVPKKDVVIVVEGLVDRVQAYQFIGPIPPPQEEAPTP